MSEWQKVKFLDVVHLNPRISLEKGVEYPFVEMSNVVPCARKPEKDVFKKYLGEGTKFEQGDTIVARIEPCLQNGKGFQCSYKQGFGSTEFLVFRPVNINDLDCDFLYYYMGQQSIREAMAKTMVGASGRQRVNNKVFNDLQINLPPLSTQHRIANILSRYDSLIENYQKQIKLLEEAARRLYKEWFIDLRFPGHENTKIVDGVPEGWEKKKISDVCETVGGGTPSTKVPAYYKGGRIKWVTPTDITRNNCICLLDTDKKITEEGLRNSSTKMVPAGTILMTSRASVGYFGIADFEVCTNQGFISCIPIPNMQMYLLFNLMSRVDEIRKKAGGSTYLEISKSVFRNFDIVCPSEIILLQFQDKASLVLKKEKTLSLQLRLLAEARDRLLPKLMSGEITV